MGFTTPITTFALSSALDGRHGAVHGGAEAHAALLVRQGHVHQGGAEGNVALAVELLALAQVHGQVVGVAGVHVGAHVRSDEEALLEEDAFVARLAVRGGAFRVEMVEVQIAHVPGVRPAAEGLDEAVRHAGDTAQMDMTMGGDVTDRLVGGNVLDRLHFEDYCYFCKRKCSKFSMHTKEEKLAAFGRLLDTMDALREKCPWNAAQTMESIRPMTEEEVYELSDAILKGDRPGTAKEIGDLLYHLVFYARIAQEEGSFDIADSLDKVVDKMVFRHPHVFGPEAGKPTSAKEIADTWELVKAKEKDGNKTVLSGIPDAMPALLKALSMQEKARGCGFDWEQPADVWDKVGEELGEAREACDEQDPRHMEEEFGDLLFAVINAARLYGVDPEAALSGTCSKFRRRFTYLEEQTLKKGRKLTDLTLAEMDAIWDEGKSKGL